MALVVGLFGAGILSTELLVAIAAQTRDFMAGSSSPNGDTEQVEDWIEASRAAKDAGPPKANGESNNSTSLESLGNTQAILQPPGSNLPKGQLRKPKIEPSPQASSQKADNSSTKVASSAAAVPASAPPQQQGAAAYAGGSPWQRGSFPVENFQSYTSAFGYRGSGGRWEFHRGLDLAAPKGSYIRNWWAGKVIKISDGDRCGTAVRIQSGNWQHVYCHMKGRAGTRDGRRYLKDPGSGVELWEGQMVQTGARIGRIGMTGRTTGPHLHWGIKYGKDWIDPALVLRAMYTPRS